MNDGYIGKSSNSLIAIASDDYTTNSSELVATTKCVNDAIKDTTDFIVDNKTIIEKDKKIISKDIAINGDDTDLASERGIFNSKSMGSVDYNTLLTQGFYTVYATGSTNGPGGPERRVIVLADTKDDDNPTQIAATSNSSVSERVQLHIRSRNSTGGWTDWVKFISEHDLATSSTPGIVQLNNTTSSTSTAQAATANAVKLAYDKAVDALESAGSSFASAKPMVLSGKKITAPAGGTWYCCGHFMANEGNSFQPNYVEYQISQNYAGGEVIYSGTDSIRTTIYFSICVRIA